jgi:large subunit ribosomal protein L30
MAAMLRIVQVKSGVGARPQARDTLRTLGLGRIGARSEREDGPALQGALRSVAHLVRVER